METFFCFAKSTDIRGFCKKYQHQRFSLFAKSIDIRDFSVLKKVHIYIFIFFVSQEVPTSESIDWILKRQNKMGFERSVGTLLLITSYSQKPYNIHQINFEFDNITKNPVLIISKKNFNPYDH